MKFSWWVTSWGWQGGSNKTNLTLSHLICKEDCFLQSPDSSAADQCWLLAPWANTWVSSWQSLFYRQVPVLILLVKNQKVNEYLKFNPVICFFCFASAMAPGPLKKKKKAGTECGFGSPGNGKGLGFIRVDSTMILKGESVLLGKGKSDHRTPWQRWTPTADSLVPRTLLSDSSGSQRVNAKEPYFNLCLFLTLTYSQSSCNSLR